MEVIDKMEQEPIRLKSAGAIVFTVVDGEARYLLLKHVKTGKHWGFPKGTMQKGETEKDTAKREIKEETGLANIEFIEDFEEKNEFSFEHEGQKYSKSVVYFLANSNVELAELSEEHSNYAWGTFAQTMDKLDKEDLKSLFKKADTNVRELS